MPLTYRGRNHQAASQRSLIKETYSSPKYRWILSTPASGLHSTESAGFGLRSGCDAVSWGRLKVRSALGGMFAEHLECGRDILHPPLSNADDETLS